MGRRRATMDIRIIYLPSGGLAEMHGNQVRLTTPSLGALAAHRLMRREIQAVTLAEAEEAVGRELIPGLWWRTTAGAKTTAMFRHGVPGRVSRRLRDALDRAEPGFADAPA
jgi:hypothetical protein